MPEPTGGTSSVEGRNGLGEGEASGAGDPVAALASRAGEVVGAGEARILSAGTRWPSASTKKSRTSIEICSSMSPPLATPKALCGLSGSRKIWDGPAPMPIRGIG
jgi:hypothetical protein